MDSIIREVSSFIPCKKPFPCAGDVRQIIRADKSEWLVKVLEVSKMEWVCENEKVIGVRVDMSCKVLEEVRPASLGKLKLV